MKTCINKPTKKIECKTMTFTAKPNKEKTEELFNGFIKPGLFSEIITKNNKFYFFKLTEEDSNKIKNMTYEEYNNFKEKHNIEYDYENYYMYYVKK